MALIQCACHSCLFGIVVINVDEKTNRSKEFLQVIVNHANAAELLRCILIFFLSSIYYTGVFHRKTNMNQPACKHEKYACVYKV